VSQSASAYSHLKTRLREDILNVLLMQESPKRIVQANRAAVFECWKKMAQVYVLIFRGAKSEGARILKSASLLANKYELFAERVMIDHVTREALFRFTEENQLNSINEDIRKGLEVWTDVLRSEELSFVMTLPHLYENSDVVKAREFEKDMIDELKNLYNKSNTARIGFWYYMAHIEYCMHERMFNEAINAGLAFLRLVESSPSLRSKNNMAGVNQTLGGTYLELRQFDNAQKYFMQAEALFPPTTGFNRLQCLQFLVQATVAKGDYAMAMEQVDKALDHPRISVREQLVPQWLFIQASIEFLKGDVDASFRTLNR